MAPTVASFRRQMVPTLGHRGLLFDAKAFFWSRNGKPMFFHIEDANSAGAMRELAAQCQPATIRMNIAVHEGSAYLFLLVEMVTTDEIHLVFGVGRVLND